MPFTKGQSGNPGGRPKVLAEVRQLAQQHGAEAIEGLLGIARDAKSPAAARVAAYSGILDRGYGRATQPVEALIGAMQTPPVVIEGIPATLLATLAASSGANGATVGVEREADRAIRSPWAGVPAGR